MPSSETAWRLTVALAGGGRGGGRLQLVRFYCCSRRARDEWMGQSPQSVSRLGPLPLDGRAGCRMSQHGADELVLRRDLGVGLSGRMSLARALSGDETSLALHCMAAATAPEKMARRPHEKDPRLARKRDGDQGTSYKCPPST
ncbi:hypothetical protein Purlil1_11026 [Purpureocillium lilacinum]|uniref:Uncharacterized protein n=1 Tax=Purpureocillium lilacinum TaxID=33203 RepID=A0ABR0BKW6_PURLI|nr:hypothetical protein Purlil1_11026 [Purpureocillium lilacinum]